ncbi:MAG: hypothetical protein V1827_00540 [Candidatus Micrarchaeota archaeon]
MSTVPNRSKGFASLDALASLVPILLMLSLLFQASRSMADHSMERMSAQEAYDKLVSIADYTVKSGAVVREGDIRYPNWIDENLLGDGYADALRDEAALADLYIGLAEPDGGYDFCIYRIVVSGEEKAIGRLFVCGG